MFQSLKRQWKAFKGGRPGRRFQDRYEQNRKTRPSQPLWLRILKPLLAIVIFAGGVVLCFIPGPGIPLIIIGAGLLADEARPLARAMDSSEVRLRKILRRAKSWWRSASWVAKDAVILAGVLVMCGMAYGGYRFIASH